MMTSAASHTTSAGQPLLAVTDLRTEFVLPQGVLRAVDGVSFTLEAGKTLGVVGESGSGKSVLARSLIGLLPAGVARTPAGRIDFNGRDLRQLGEREMRGVRGKEIAMIFQDPLTSLNPVLTIGRQLEQVLRQHTDLSARAARERAVELLADVGIADPRQRASEYAHRLSGGMRQRVVIAIALACTPRLLIADEPTTALDVTVQAQILDLLRRLQERHAMAMLLITHNFGVVAEMCDDVAVMYAGRMVEQGSVADVLRRPRMRYTHALLQSVPRADAQPHARLPAIPGQPPDLTAPPAGCRFAPRCAARAGQCDSAAPHAMPAGGGHFYACWHPVQENLT
ncbi:oligopeptide transporter subunit; ATP-binding component of ABC superfamily [Cupriavidus taiwanensis]|uniref:ABC transporter ATP-binding protein n=1 Tax=Cupriavidus taiwanensis TaxID=164546 RepID=UPI000E10E34E|nr:ABC transporter ATP-binding protein [Cupriavidus taiwanensis]SPA43379.1 oligopeptide transporter subunit; ATP-binding component of ABC superfamily [Cupriavidus taiwanensis]